MRVPSGDHRAEEPLIRKRCLPPSAFITQSADSHLSLSLSTQRRVKTICLPSGEICGSATSCKSRYISRLSFLLCAGAATGAAAEKTSASTTSHNPPTTARRIVCSFIQESMRERKLDKSSRGRFPAPESVRLVGQP